MLYQMNKRFTKFYFSRHIFIILPDILSNKECKNRELGKCR